MPFGRIMKKLIRFLSPKEHAGRDDAASGSDKKKGPSWEPLTLKNEAARFARESGRHGRSPEAPEKPEAAKEDAGILQPAFYYLKHNRKAAAIAVAALITLLFYRYVIPVYVILIFIAIASVSKMVQDWIPFVVGFDLVLFVTVLSGAAYGWKAAVVVGPVSSLIGSSLRRVTSQQFDTIIFPAIGYGIIAAIIPYLPAMSIFWLGMICTFIYVLVMNVVFAYFRPDIFNHATFTVTSLLFNYWLFKNFAEPLFSLISG